MAVFVELTTDPFEANYTRLKSRNDPSLSRPGRAGLSNVRRPLRGIEVKEDTYGALKVLRSDGSEIPFLDSSDPTGSSTSYSNFIIQSVQEARMEKHQIVETFGDPYIFFFGEAPRFVDVTAVLLNSFDFNWEAEWWANWENTLRGSKSVENGARTYLFYDDTVLEGYMLMSQAVKQSSEPIMIQLTFRMFVTSARNVSFVGDPNYPVAASVDVSPDISLTNPSAGSQLIGAYSTPTRYAQYQRSVLGDPAFTSTPATFGAAGNLVDSLRKGARAIGWPSTVQSMIDYVLNAQGATTDLNTAETISAFLARPLRSKIADNQDEYTGSGGIAVDYTKGELPEVYDPRVRSALQVDSLFHSAISWMACFGANLNSYSAMAGLGLGVNFGAGAGIGIGLGASVGAGIGAGATFGAIARNGVGYGGSAGTGFGFSAGFQPAQQYGSAASISAINSRKYTPSYASQQYAQAAQGNNNDVLFSAVGGAVKATGTVGPIDSKLGDPYYGYPSPYGAPGMGRAGFGDYGGAGFGASFGKTGDPGFLAPDKFTFAGVPSGSGALERLTAANPGYGLGFGGTSIGDSFAGVGAGGSVAIGGSVTAFAISALPGTLDASGHSLLNPYKVSCENNVVGVGVNLLAML